MRPDSITVLHVDDEEPSLDLTKTCLERCNPNLSIISELSVTDALRQLEDNTIDCIISDYEMSQQNGIDFLHEVRSEYPKLPFILYTHKEPDDIGDQAVEVGIDSFFHKQIGTAQYPLLANEITTLVEKYHAEQRLTYLEREKHIADGGIYAREDITTDEDELMSMTVVKAIAERENADPIALEPPLYEVIDPDALDALFHVESEKDAQGSVEMTFSYLEYTITISSDCRIKIEE